MWGQPVLGIAWARRALVYSDAVLTELKRLLAIRSGRSSLLSDRLGPVADRIRTVRVTKIVAARLLQDRQGRMACRCLYNGEGLAC